MEGECPLGALRCPEQVTCDFYIFKILARLKIKEMPKEGNTQCGKCLTFIDV